MEADNSDSSIDRLAASPMRRRRFLAVVMGVGATAAAAAPTALKIRGAGAQAIAQPVSPLPGTTLPIPPLLSPPVQDGLRTFDLTLQNGETAFQPVPPVHWVLAVRISGPRCGEASATP